MNSEYWIQLIICGMTLRQQIYNHIKINVVNIMKSHEYLSFKNIYHTTNASTHWTIKTLTDLTVPVHVSNTWLTQFYACHSKTTHKATTFLELMTHYRAERQHKNEKFTQATSRSLTGTQSQNTVNRWVNYHLSVIKCPAGTFPATFNKVHYKGLL